METAFILGAILGIVLMGFALLASFSEFDNDQWRKKNY